ncbi:lipase-GDSL family acetylesterase [Listeria weihenstephanensis FSL R9-0317]|uniref:GDSL-type esterase/lipase family protein n=1 Tax=Listeria weihenstephanensis TaxID=1006155 RepID=UPI0003E86864|nr:GDSL-type esterase/lipase family protein [Listeria weihenstephanensis]EUJ39599.1 lipase-GDSL family acetylesterase [Listeria weihenstephanensis FSL R9-0317]
MMKKLMTYSLTASILVAIFILVPLSAKVMAQSFIPTVNIVTTAGNTVALPSEVDQADSAYKLTKTKVTWDNVDPTIFNQVGKHKVHGKTVMTGEPVQGAIHVFGTNKPVNVAAIGDSITYGMNVENVTENAYPKQLNNRLGVNYNVTNFGNSGKTLLENGDAPFIRTTQYTQSLASNPDVVIVQLGTNDSKPANFQRISAFVDDYVKLINKYTMLASKPVVYVSLPPIVFKPAYAITQEKMELILPKIVEAAEKADLDVSIIDNQTATIGAGAFVPDGVHPNGKGAAILANNVYHTITGAQPELTGEVLANAYNTSYGAINAVPTTADKTLFLSNIATENWVSYSNVKFHKSLENLEMYAAIPYDATTVEVKLDSPTGTTIGTKILNKTGSATSWSWHTIPVAETTGNHDVYFIFSRPTTTAGTEIARLGKIDFSYEAVISPEITSAQDLEDALTSGLTDLKLMNDIVLTKNLLLHEDTKLDLNGHVLNTTDFYLSKDEAAGKRIQFDIFDGQVTGLNANGSIYNPDSENDSNGMHINAKDIMFHGTLFIRSNVNGTVVTFDGHNVIQSTTGSNVYARNITIKTGAYYFGSTEGGGSSNESGSTVITMGTSNTDKHFIVEPHAKVELSPGSIGIDYRQNAIYGFSKIKIGENASFIAIGARPMLRTDYTAENARVEVAPNARFDVRTTEALEGFSYTHGIDYVFDHVAYLNIESPNKTSFMTANQNSSIHIYSGTISVWTATNTTQSWAPVESFQLSGENMKSLTTSSEELQNTFGSLANYVRLTNQN